MSITKDNVTATILRAVDELNKLYPPNEQLTKDPDTVLFGEGGVLDSLGLINLIVMVEAGVKNDYAVQIIILEEDALANLDGPYRSIDTLATWIHERLI